MNNEELTKLITQIVISAFGTTGLLEFIKNFIKTSKTWIYSIIMPFLSVGCFCCSYYLPFPIIGGILTIGVVQLDYQVIVQGLKKLIDSKIQKLSGTESETEE